MLKNLLGACWETLAVEEGPQENGIGALLVQARVKGGGNEGNEGGRRKGDRRGRAGGAMKNRNNKTILNYRKNEWSQPKDNRSTPEGCVGGIPQVQSKLMRVLHAPRGNEPLEDGPN